MGSWVEFEARYHKKALKISEKNAVEPNREITLYKYRGKGFRGENQSRISVLVVDGKTAQVRLLRPHVFAMFGNAGMVVDGSGIRKFIGSSLNKRIYYDSASNFTEEPHHQEVTVTCGDIWIDDPGNLSRSIHGLIWKPEGEEIKPNYLMSGLALN